MNQQTTYTPSDQESFIKIWQLLKELRALLSLSHNDTIQIPAMGGHVLAAFQLNKSSLEINQLIYERRKIIELLNANLLISAVKYPEHPYNTGNYILTVDRAVLVKWEEEYNQDPRNPEMSEAKRFVMNIIKQPVQAKASTTELPLPNPTPERVENLSSNFHMTKAGIKHGEQLILPLRESGGKYKMVEQLMLHKKIIKSSKYTDGTPLNLNHLTQNTGVKIESVYRYWGIICLALSKMKKVDKIECVSNSSNGKTTYLFIVRD